MLVLVIFHSKLFSRFFSSEDKAHEVRITKTYMKISCIYGIQDYTRISPLRYVRRCLSWAIPQKKGRRDHSCFFTLHYRFILATRVSLVYNLYSQEPTPLVEHTKLQSLPPPPPPPLTDPHFNSLLGFFLPVL